MAKITKSTNDQEWADDLTEMLRRLDALAQPLPKDAPLHRFIEDTYEPLGCLLGYFLGGLDDPADALAEAPGSEKVSPSGKSEPMAQASALRGQARVGGMRIEAYLPPVLADWLLSRIEDGTFSSPDEAASILLMEARVLDVDDNLRAELLRRALQAETGNPQSAAPTQEALKTVHDLQKALPSPPAAWEEKAMAARIPDDFLVPPPVVNDAAFERVCSVLDIADPEERQLARMAIGAYETVKQRHSDKH